MSENLPQLFDYENHQLRTFIKENEPWFVGLDACNILEIKNSRDALKRLKDSQKDVVSIYTLGGKQDVTIVSESGLYKLVMKSRKKEAEAFQDWICEKVIPSIRKTGSYSVNNITTPQNYIEALEDIIKREKEKEKLLLENKIQSQIIENQAPAQLFYEDFTNSDNLKSLTDLGKYLSGRGLGANRLSKLLIEKGIIYKDKDGKKWPYTKYNNCFKVIPSEYIIITNSGQEVKKPYNIILLLQKGYNLIISELSKDPRFSFINYKQLNFNDVPIESNKFLS